MIREKSVGVIIRGVWGERRRGRERREKREKEGNPIGEDSLFLQIVEHSPKIPQMFHSVLLAPYTKSAYLRNWRGEATSAFSPWFPSLPPVFGGALGCLGLDLLVGSWYLV